LTFKGKVYKYGADVNTDVIIPARYLNVSEPRELAQHCMEDIDADFVKNVQPGDIKYKDMNKDGKIDVVARDQSAFGDPETGKKRAYDTFSVYFNMDNGRGRFKGVQMQGNEFARSIFKEWIKPFHDIGLKTLTIRYTGSTDHIPFDRAGLPAFQFLQDRFGIGSGHTNTDFFDTLLEEDLMVNAVVIASFAYHAAMRDGLFPRKTKNIKR